MFTSSDKLPAESDPLRRFTARVKTFGESESCFFNTGAPCNFSCCVACYGYRKQRLRTLRTSYYKVGN